MSLASLKRGWRQRSIPLTRWTPGRYQLPFSRGSDSQTLHEASDRDRSALRDLPVLPTGAEPRLKLVGRKSRAVAAEVDTNPRARSALLRVAQKIK